MTGKEILNNDGRDATVVIVDGRQSAAAAAIGRGVIRFLSSLAYACVSELPLPNGQRADIVALTKSGGIVIVEIKSCLNDFRTDQKWEGYRDYCDELYFAVDAEFPSDVLPADAGFILADRYGAEIVRAAQSHTLNAARRKAITLRFARYAAQRLSSHLDAGLAQFSDAYLAD